MSRRCSSMPTFAAGRGSCSSGDRNGFFYVLDRLTGELLMANRS